MPTMFTAPCRALGGVVSSSLSQSPCALSTGVINLTEFQWDLQRVYYYCKMC